jgi:hypothetical protein
MALIAAPAPLLPPHRLAEAFERIFGLQWLSAYLVAAVVLEVAFYFSLGLLAGLVVSRTQTIGGRIFQIAILPTVTVALAIVIRSLKGGHFPVWVNTVVPICACLFGVALGLGWLYSRLRLTALGSVTVLSLALWGLVDGASSSLQAATNARLQRLVVMAPGLPTDEDRFGVLLRAAFVPLPTGEAEESAIEQNRASILAWGIALGHPKLARFTGLDPDSEVVHRAAALAEGTTIRGHEDWPRHYAVSAALAILEHPLISDSAGLMKEQLDALSQGSGFSFRDLAADQAGARFAIAATSSEAAALAMQRRLQNSYFIDDFFPRVEDLPPDLTAKQFRRDFGGVGTVRYRLQVAKIENLLDGCAAISGPYQ